MKRWVASSVGPSTDQPTNPSIHPSTQSSPHRCVSALYPSTPRFTPCPAPHHIAPHHTYLHDCTCRSSKGGSLQCEKEKPTYLREQGGAEAGRQGALDRVLVLLHGVADELHRRAGRRDERQLWWWWWWDGVGLVLGWGVEGDGRPSPNQTRAGRPPPPRVGTHIHPTIHPSMYSH